MTVHKLFAMEIADAKVFAIEAFGHLYIPMRSLVESTLGMNWSGQAAKLKRIDRHRRPQILTTAAASSKTTQQPCLRDYRVEGFLWSLRPGRDDVRARLIKIRDAWPGALLHYHGFSREEDIGASFVAQIAGRATDGMAGRIRELEASITRLQQENIYLRGRPGNPIEKRYGKPLAGCDLFLRIKQMADGGVTNAYISRELGCSRTLVSLFLAGKYKRTDAALEALDILASQGWFPGQTIKSHPMIAVE